MNAKLATTLSAIVSLTAPLAAQDHAHTVGVGITVPDVGLMLPIDASQHFRIEPYVVFFAARLDFPVSSDTEWESGTRLGVGLFSVSHPTELMRVYVGPRFGLLWGSSSVDGPSTSGKTSTSNHGWFLGAAIGGEYRPVAQIGVGGEAKIEYLHTSASSSGAGTVSISPELPTRDWYSTGALVVRFYP